MSSHHHRDHHHSKHRSSTPSHTKSRAGHSVDVHAPPTVPSSRGGESMVWNYSTDSTNSSGRSHRTSSSSYYSISSPTTSYSYGSTSASSASASHGAGGLAAAYTSAPFGEFMESPTSTTLRSPSTPRSYGRATPATLGWLPDTKLWKLYKFVVTKGKEPYLELLPEYVCTAETPARVYLDPPSASMKNSFPCQFPGGCSGKRVFSRPADLDRHYKNVHASVDQKDLFPCDYGPCARSKEPFTRKDHYRDHLKDFHKEDLGSAKAGKVDKGSSKWQQLQDQWLRERRISYKFWRCARCLGRVRVDEQGWVCGRCGVECERHRIEAREELRRKEEKAGKRKSASGSSGAAAAAGGSSSSGGGAGGSSLQPQQAQWSYSTGCGVCHGSGWVEDTRSGGYLTCLSCQPSTSSSVAYSTSDWAHSSYPSGSGYYG